MEKKSSPLLSKLKKVWNVSAYALGYGTGGGVMQIQSIYYMNFLMFAMHIPYWQVALILGLTKFWDAVIDPVIGVFVDKTNTKLGSCRPWILAAVVPIAVTYFMMWYSFGITDEFGKFAYFFFAQILFSTALSVGTVPYEAILPRMVEGYDERTNFSAFRMIFSGVYAVGATWLYPMIIKTEDLSLFDTQIDNFMLLGIVFGIVFAIPMLVTFIGTKEKIHVSDDEKLSVKNVFKSYSEILKPKLYRKYFAINMLGTFVSNALTVSLLLFFLLNYGGNNDTGSTPLGIGSIALPFALSFLVVNFKGAFEIAFFVPNVIMMKKFNKQFPLKVDLPILFAGLLIFLFVDSSTPFWIALAGLALMGAGSSCLGIVPNTLMPDLVDVDELTFGKRREGKCGGLITLGRQIVQGVAFLVFGFILAAFELSEDKTTAADATPVTLAAVKIMLCVLPILSGVVMFLISRTYNLDAKSHALIKLRIAEKHENIRTEIPENERKIFADITGMKYEDLWIAK
ncbi:MAG: MFS transporter [Clostridiales bacterium]|jgi:Na+/melibiose symporter-like transporter|nr:MFS transporter [Clostridiales bacterium]